MQFTTKEKQDSLEKKLMIPESEQWKYKMNLELCVCVCVCVRQKKGNTQRIMGACQKDTDMSFRGLSVAKYGTI